MIKKLIGMVLGFLAVTVLGVAVYGYTIYQQGTETLSKKTYKKSFYHLMKTRFYYMKYAMHHLENNIRPP